MNFLPRIKPPVPRVHRLLFNIGISAAGAAEIIRSCRYDRDWMAGDILRGVIQNRRAFTKPLPGSARYRPQ